ncbi:MAG: Fic family protein [Candidatus Diapherotrites archaeon]
MGKVIQRTVKGKPYYYLERSIRIGKKVRKVYLYLGAINPAKSKLASFRKKLDQKVKSFYREQLLKSKTRFIDVKTAVKLEAIKQETQLFLDQLSAKQKKQWVERERDKFITNTNAIEGSTLSLDETQRILRLGARLGSQRERLEVLNMERCLVQFEESLTQKRELDEKLILEWHTTLLNKIPDYDQYKGIWRPVNVFLRVSSFHFPPHSQVPKMMKEMMEDYQKNNDLIHPVELAAMTHCMFTTIHPFADGNGRMARLIMNYILQFNGFPFTNIPVLKRDPYFETQEKGHRTEYGPFTHFLVEQLKENYAQMKKEN